MNLVSRFMTDESGATAIEYGLIAAIVSVAIIGSLKAVSGSLKSTFTNVSNELNTANTPSQ
jgi:pilus assembly protein Flp/PilA